ncbi:MAG TPA: hypothetical protein VHU83_06605 [Bryobacteraceae bacterium]|nr:hypothetical protein [Bryobacteraceae bacterium]
MAVPENHKKDPNHANLLKINTALQDGRLKGFICESIGTLEAIHKPTRPEYFSNRIPKTTLTAGTNTDLNITIKVDHDRHPGLEPILIQKLQRAGCLGMRLLYIPSANNQLPKEFLNDHDLYESRLFETQSYADRFWEIAREIETRGVGVGAVAAILKELEERLPVSIYPRRGMQLLQYAKDDAEKARISKAIAEWADGDLVASHIASGNDLLCTEDKGKSTGGRRSVFDKDNQGWLKATYNIRMVDRQQLATQIPS